VTRNVAKLPQHPLRKERPAARPGCKCVRRSCEWPRNRRTHAPRGSTAICFQGRDDGAHEAGRMGCAASARGVDSRGNTALGSHVGPGFDENALLSAGPLPHAAWRMSCDECLSAVEGVNSSCMQICKVEQESFAGERDYRNHSRSIEGSRIDPAPVAATL